MERVSEMELSEAQRFQQRIEPYRTRLYQAVMDSGALTGARIDHDHHAVILFGVGEPSPGVAAVIADAADFLQVLWPSAPYTRAELLAEIGRLMLASTKLNTGAPAPTAPRSSSRRPTRGCWRQATRRPR
jgi:hypothetical protein